MIFEDLRACACRPGVHKFSRELTATWEFSTLERWHETGCTPRIYKYWLNQGGGGGGREKEEEKKIPNGDLAFGIYAFLV